MVGHLLCLDLSVLDVHLVTTQHNGYTVTDMFQVAVPQGNVVVRHPRCDIEHDDGTMSLDVVAVSESTKLLLTGRVPDVEFDGASGGVEY